MTVKFTRPSINIRETLDQLNKPSGIAGNAMLAAETPQEQFNLIGAGRKNLIINGGFDVWQRGTSFAGTDPGTFSADRFNVAYSDTVNTMAVTRSSIVPDGFTYSMEITGSASQYPATGVELPVTGKGGIFAKGKKFTYSLYSDNPVAPMLYVLFRDVIHGGTGSSVLILAKEMSVIESDSSNGFIRYAITFDITDVPDAGNQCLTVAPRFFNTTVDETYRVTGVQLELGSVATPFEHRSYGEELALCQRYYYRLNVVADTALMIGNSLSTSIAYYTLVLPRPLRGVPTVNQSGFLNYRQRGASTNVTTTVTLGSAFYSPGNSIVQVQTSSSGLPNTVEVMIYSSTGNTGYIEVDAEL